MDLPAAVKSKKAFHLLPAVSLKGKERKKKKKKGSHRQNPEPSRFWSGSDGFPRLAEEPYLPTAQLLLNPGSSFHRRSSTEA